jgi:hypothetical protein
MQGEICQSWSSGFQHCVDLWVVTSALEEHTAFNFRQSSSLPLDSIFTIMQVGSPSDSADSLQEQRKPFDALCYGRNRPEKHLPTEVL